MSSGRASEALSYLMVLEARSRTKMWKVWFMPPSKPGTHFMWKVSEDWLITEQFSTGSGATGIIFPLCKVESTMCCFYYYWKQFYTQKENNTFLLPRLIGKFLDTSRHYRLSTTCSVFCCWYAQQLREFATEAARACLLSNALNIHFEKRSIMQTEVWRWRGEGRQ